MSNEQSGDVILAGDKVYLGQVRRDLAPVYRRWLNDLRVARTMGIISYQGLPLTDEDEFDWFDSVRADKGEVMFGIYELGAGRPVGNCGLSETRIPNRSAEFGIAIGEQDARGKGYGTEATRLALDYGFNILGLHHIWLKCVEFNHAGIRAYEKAGFQQAGRLREAWQLGGKQYDVLLMDVLARDFESPVVKELLDIPGDE
ncbi:MAG: N-acetyltransferase [Sphaerobacteraceae bacterium]|nr:MAG: N-acetyltransferase [Sphaerobacteraceae bacterium]